MAVFLSCRQQGAWRVGVCIWGSFVVLANAEERSTGLSAASGLALCTPARLTQVCEVWNDRFRRWFFLSTSSLWGWTWWGIASGRLLCYWQTLLLGDGWFPPLQNQSVKSVDRMRQSSVPGRGARSFLRSFTVLWVPCSDIFVAPVWVLPGPVWEDTLLFCLVQFWLLIFHKRKK